MDDVGIYSMVPSLPNEISVQVDGDKFSLTYKDLNNITIKTEGLLPRKTNVSNYGQNKPVVRLVPILLPVIETQDQTNPESLVLPKGYSIINKQRIRLLVPNESIKKKKSDNNATLNETPPKTLIVRDVTGTSNLLSKAIQISLLNKTIQVAEESDTEINLQSTEDANIINETVSDITKYSKNSNTARSASKSIEITEKNRELVSEDKSPVSKPLRSLLPKLTEIPTEKIKTEINSENIEGKRFELPIDKILECSHCDFSTSIFDEFWDHIKVHNSFDCPLCKKSFRYIDLMRQHLKFAHNPKLNVSEKGLLIIENKLTDNENETPQIDSEEELDENSDSYSNNDNEFDSSGEESPLDEPLETVTKSNLEITDGNKSDGYSSNDSQKTEKVKKSQESLFFCAHCGHKDEDFESFAAHYANHKRTFICPLCSSTIVNANFLLTHIMETHKYSAKLNDKEELLLMPNEGDENGEIKIFGAEEYILKDDKAKDAITIEYHCQVCGFFASEYETYSNHVRTDHLKECACPNCDRKFDNELKMFEHFKELDCGMFHLPGKPEFNCKLCDRNTFSSEKALALHLKLVHKKKCLFCNEQLPNKKDLLKHMSANHPTGCRQCRLIFSDNEELYRHRMTHVKKDYNCTECGKIFHKQSYFHDHCNYHKGIKTHRCKFCNKMFSYYTNLVSHREAEHIQREHEHLCDVCGKCLKSRRSLRHHKLIHAKVHLDGTSFKRKMSKSSPENVRPKRPRRSNIDSKYNCKFCGSNFCNAFILKQHQDLHLRSSSFECSQCGLFFKNRKTLWIHVEQLCDENEAVLLDHSRKEPTQKVDRRFKCSICNTAAVNSWILKQHEVVHYKVNDFQCECGLYFKTEETLISHKEVVGCTGNAPIKNPADDFQCLCGLYFTTEETLKYHVEVRGCHISGTAKTDKTKEYITKKEDTSIPGYRLVKKTTSFVGDLESDVYEMIEVENDENSQSAAAEEESSEQYVISEDANADVVEFEGGEETRDVIVQQMEEGFTFPTDGGSYVIQVSEDGMPIIVPEGLYQKCYIDEDGVQYVVQEVND